MLKKVVGSGLFLLVILCGVMFSQSASASVADPVIAQVQTGTSSAPTQEFISVYNNSPSDVEVTAWCLGYSSSSDVTQTSLGCLNAPDAQTKLWLKSHTYFTAASSDFVTAHPGFVADITFAAGLADAGGHVKLLDINKAEVDRIGYGTATHPETTTVPKAATGKILQRSGTTVLQDTDNNAADFVQVTPTALPGSGLYEVVTPIDVCPNLDGLQTNLPVGDLKDSDGNCRVDVCQNIPDLQVTIPSGYESADGATCTLIPLPPPENAPLFITELLPNAASTDTGNEFIELYNPNTRPVNLKDYKLELGPSFSKSYVFPDQVLAPGGYASFSDTITGIVLPNTNASLRLTAPAGNVVDETETYDSPADDMAWAVIGGAWQYTNQPTPGSANLTSLVGGSGGGGASTSILEPCGEGKFRNPDTNRCKTIDDSSNQLAPCAPDQIRNPDTNRCRSVLATSSSLTPCQPGQERNPDTNRCRSAAATATAALKACAANQERNPDTNRCRNKSSSSAAAGKIKDIEAPQSGGQSGWLIAGGTVVAAAGYGAWEWRSEVAGGFRRFRQLFGKSPISG